MNTKKAQWLKKPSRFDEYMLHTVKYTSGGKEEVFFTIGEEGTLRLSAECGSGVTLSFVFFHTPQDRVVFNGTSVKMYWRGIESIHNVLNPITELEINKKGEEISFSASGSVILRIKNPAFLSSSSFGIVTEGSGGVTLSVW